MRSAALLAAAAAPRRAAAAAAPPALASRRVSGIVVGAYTPFERSDPLAPAPVSVIEAYAGVLGRAGADWVFVCGTVGESVSLTVPERERVAEEWVRRGHAAGLRIMVHVGTDSVVDARRLAAHAQAAGADAVAAMPPTYFRPKTADALVRHLALLFSAAPELPAFYYHNPAATMVEVDVGELVALADAAIPSFRGVKYSDAALAPFDAARKYRSASRAEPAFDIVMGKGIDNLWDALQRGGEAFIGNSHIFLAARRIVDLHREGKEGEAREVQQRVSRQQKVLKKYGTLAAGKAIMKMMGIDVGPPRSPNAPLNDEQVSALRAELAEAGFRFDAYDQSGKREL